MTTGEWKERVECASAVPIERVAPFLGMELVRCGQSLRHKDYDSLKINGNLWKRWSGRTGLLGRYVQGSTIQLVEEYAGIGFRDAVRHILEIAAPELAGDMMRRGAGRASLGKRIASIEERHTAPLKCPARPFTLPPKSRVSENVYRYLTQERAILPEIVKRELAAGRLYEDTRQNCVFAGWDGTGQPAFAAIRSTSPRNPFRMDYAGSRKAHGWRAVPNAAADTVLAFESPIEAMSYMSIIAMNGKDWERSAYVSLGGVGGAALFNYLDSHQETAHICLCLNNDAAGRAGAEKIAEKIDKSVQVVLPGKEGQDWNDVLRERRGTHRQLWQAQDICR